MEDPMDENKDDILGSRVEIGRKKNKIKMRKASGMIRIFGSRNKKKIEQMRKEESGACMQPYLRDDMVYFGKLTQGRDK